MNDNIDLTKILKNCPKGTKLYSPIWGEIYFEEMRSGERYSIITTKKGGYTVSFTKEGLHYADEDGECVLFPNKEQRDWSKFTAPWYKKKRFNPKTLKPFDKVLIKDSYGNWSCDLFSYIKKENIDCKYVASGFCSYTYCIPYNNDTKHLIGTADEVPEYYKYWED